MASLITISSLSAGAINGLEGLELPETIVEPKTAAVETLTEPHTVQTLRELVRSKAAAAGVDKALALRIAFCESTYRQFGKNDEVLRGVHNPDDVGLFQINEKFHLDKSRELGYDIYATEGNIDYAVWLLKNRGTSPWRWSRRCWSA